MSKATDEELLQISNETLRLDDDLADVLEALDAVKDQWKNIGVHLRVPMSKLNQLESTDKGLTDMLVEWLNCNYDTVKHGEPSWRMLAKAVSIVNGRVYKDIAKDHPTVVSEPPPSDVSNTTEVHQHQATPNATPTSTTPVVSAPEPPLPDHPALHAQPTPKTLLFIKYPDSNGQLIYVRTKQELAPKWKQVGEAFGIAKAKLAIWYTQYHNDEERVDAVLGHWLDNGSRDYSFNWAGLLELCDALHLHQFAVSLHKALIATYKK